MSLELETPSIKIIGDVENYVQALEKAQRATTKFQTTLRKALGSVGATSPSAALVSGATGGGGGSVGAKAKKDLSDAEQGEEAARKFEERLKRGRVQRRKKEVEKERDDEDK